MNDPLPWANYAEYLKSDRWRTLRREKLAEAGRACQICNRGEAYGLEVHHRTYQRQYAEWLSDLTVLCRACHRRNERWMKAPPERSATDEREPDPEIVDEERYVLWHVLHDEVSMLEAYRVVRPEFFATARFGDLFAAWIERNVLGTSRIPYPDATFREVCNWFRDTKQRRDDAAFRDGLARIGTRAAEREAVTST